MQVPVEIGNGLCYNRENERQVIPMAKRSDPITILKGVGPAKAKILKQNLAQNTEKP